VGADIPIRGILSLEDNDGAGQDRSGLSLTPEFLVCPANSSVTLHPIFGGNITIHDASVLPTSKEQCKDNGWRMFPGFNNQGDCVSYVLQQRQP